LVILPLAGRIDLPFTDFPDLRAYIGGAFSVGPKLVVILVGGLLMIALGLYDDRHDLKAGPKLLAQVLIASLVAAAGMRVTLFIPSRAVSFGLTVIWIVTLTNAM